MRVLPILFNTDMVRAILDGKKTVTRCVMKPQPLFYTGRKYIFDDKEIPKKWEDCDNIIRTYQYQPGDILYIRETWQDLCLPAIDGSELHDYAYKASNDVGSIKWRPSIHMPKAAARIWLKVMDVRIERLQDINEEQVKKEGIEEYTKDGKLFKYAVSREWWEEYHRKHGKDFMGNWWQDMPRTTKEAYSYLWNSTIKKSDLAKYGWDANPWVWVIEFERCEKPESEAVE